MLASPTPCCIPTGASDAPMGSATPRSTVADTMARKKEMTDQLAEALKRLSAEVAGLKSKLQSLDDVEEDAEKAKNPGVAESVADFEAKLAARAQELKDVRQKRVQSFPEDEGRLQTVLGEVDQMCRDAKGIWGVLEQVRNDRRAEEKRQKSQVDYILKKDVNKYINMGVSRKLGMALVRLEGEVGEAGEKVETLPKIASSAWDAQRPSVHGHDAFPGGVSDLITMFDSAASARVASLKKKLDGKECLMSGGVLACPPFRHLGVLDMVGELGA